MLGKKNPKSRQDLDPTTFKMLVGLSNHCAMGDSHGEQDAGFGIATGLCNSRVRWTKAKQHTDLLASRRHLNEGLCTLVVLCTQKIIMKISVHLESLEYLPLSVLARSCSYEE